VKAIKENSLNRFNEVSNTTGSERYARFLIDELLPVVESLKTEDGARFALSKYGNDRAIGAGAAGRSVPFRRLGMPRLVSRVFSSIGTLRRLRGGNVPDAHPQVRAQTDQDPFSGWKPRREYYGGDGGWDRTNPWSRPYEGSSQLLVRNGGQTVASQLCHITAPSRAMLTAVVGPSTIPAVEFWSGFPSWRKDPDRFGLVLGGDRRVDVPPRGRVVPIELKTPETSRGIPGAVSTDRPLLPPPMARSLPSSKANRAAVLGLQRLDTGRSSSIRTARSVSETVYRNFGLNRFMNFFDRFSPTRA